MPNSQLGNIKKAKQDAIQLLKDIEAIGRDMKREEDPDEKIVDSTLKARSIMGEVIKYLNWAEDSAERVKALIPKNRHIRKALREIRSLRLGKAEKARDLQDFKRLEREANDMKKTIELISRMR